MRLMHLVTSIEHVHQETFFSFPDSPLIGKIMSQAIERKVDQGIIFHLWVYCIKVTDQKYCQKYCQAEVIHTDPAT